MPVTVTVDPIAADLAAEMVWEKLTTESNIPIPQRIIFMSKIFSQISQIFSEIWR
jgi:hypothetical protein